MSSSDEIDLDAKLSSAGPKSAAGVEGPKPASEIASTAGVQASDAVQASALETDASIAGALATGALDPVAAQELLIDQVLAEQLPSDIAPEQLERLRGELAALLAGDPTLASLLRP